MTVALINLRRCEHLVLGSLSARLNGADSAVCVKIDMITLGPYWNQAEAALAKSVLDNYEIFCALMYENAHLYGGAPFAMPIRLFIDEDQANRAHLILSGDLEGAAKLDTEVDATFLPADISANPEFHIGNPWELVVLAFYFLLPGMTVLQTKYPTIMQSDPRASRAIAAVAIIHFFGWLAAAVAVTLLAAYVCLGRSAVSRQRDTPRRDGRL